MDDSDSEWQCQGATLSDKTARTEFALTREEIFEAIRTGKLRYQVASMHGNPWFRLLRLEVEALVKKNHGGDHLKALRGKTELGVINRELKRLKTELAVLERRKAKLIADSGK